MAPQDDNADHQAHSPLIGGSMVTTFIKGSDGTYGVGTLGFFASINNVPKYKNIVLVSNVHVLGDHGGAAGDAVYQPSWTQADGNWMENFESNPVGVLRDLPAEQNHTYQYPEDAPNTALPYWVDCATALLDICVSPTCHTNCGVKFSDVQRGLDLVGGISKVTGVGRMIAADEGRLVYIVGAVSGVIEGALKHALIDVGPRKNVMEITSIDPIEPGDSGSAVVDKNGLLVGLIHRATELTTLSHASHIGPVLDILGVTPITAANEPDNPAFSGTAAAQAMAPATSPTPGGMLRQRLSETENGRRIAALIQEHQSEVVHLVNHERAVTVAWHRNKGPQFLNEAVANAVNPEHLVPREIEGISREALIRNMAKALYAHGSAEMRALCAHLEELTLYVNATDSVHDLMDIVGGARPA
ncbi:MAG TPA: hypothetical protein VOA88_15700 [Candidatus Dormibacteraeota bacterium]|nr:hypothetical protein [Candidatus Dormibacteraeota bacterium]